MNKKKPSKTKLAPRLAGPSRRRGEHHFYLIVKTGKNRKAAELAVLCAFGKRQPDGCEFHLTGAPGYKDAWMDGAWSGTETGFDLAINALERIRAEVCAKKPKSLTAK